MAQTKLNIVLCGFMGCGKSTVGKKLSQMTQMEFVDMDGYIEKRAGMKFRIFLKKHGEGFFRDLEHEAAVGAFSAGRLCGGHRRRRPDLPAECGRVQGRRRDRTAGYSSAGASAAAEKNDRNRPLLQRPDRFRFIRELHQKRMPLYRRAADVVIPTKGSPNAVCRQVLQALEEKNLTNS